MGISSRNNLQPTRNLYDFRFKSYGLLCDFHKSGDLDLNRYPIFQKFKMPGSYELHTSAAKESERSDQYCDLYTLLRRTNKQTDKQTDRQTNRGDQYTLQKSTILQSNERIIGDLTIYIDFDRPWPLTLTLDLDIDHSLFWKENWKNVMLWRHVTQNGASHMINEINSRWVFLQGITCSQLEISTTSGSKVMAYYVIFTKAVTLTLTVYPIFQKFKMPGSYELHTSAAKESERSDQYCDLYTLLRRTNKQTDKQTDRQTNRGDQYTLQKSTILQSNESRSESGYFAKSLKLQFQKSWW